MNKAAVRISNIIYGIGTAIVLGLGCTALFGSLQFVNPDAMLPFTWREQGFTALALGTIPMFLACMAVVKFNGIKNSLHKKRNIFLIFLPGLLCAAALLYIIGLLAVGMVNSFLLN